MRIPFWARCGVVDSPGLLSIIAGLLLIDGAVVNNTPISHAVELGADRVIVLQALGSKPLPRLPRGALAAGLVAVSRVLTQRLTDDIARYESVAELIVLSSKLGGILPTDSGVPRT